MHANIAVSLDLLLTLFLSKSPSPFVTTHPYLIDKFTRLPLIQRTANIVKLIKPSSCDSFSPRLISCFELPKFKIASASKTPDLIHPKT
ncbi:hypothetical protein BGZ60DRAFT_267516 [Tricladium varicosporioides]|nr:hypothetical protein BGZ60DRAFT_267516 [Hymenoscyphus varicosporioides]